MSAIFHVCRNKRIYCVPIIASVVVACDHATVSPDSSALIEGSGPYIVSTDPVDQGKRVVLEKNIRVGFDRNILNTSIGTHEFKLLSPSGSEVQGEVEFDAVDNIAVFNPVDPLLPARTYRVQLGNGIVDLEGNALDNYSWSFETSADIWEGASEIETNPGSTGQHQLAVDSTGSAFAVWMQHDGSRYNLWASAYVLGSEGSGQWGQAELMEQTDDTASYPRIALTGNGDALAVWRQANDLWSSIGLASADGLLSWSTPALVEQNAALPTRPQLAADAAGNAIAVWEQSDGTSSSIWANHFLYSTGSWAVPELIESELSAASYPEISVDAAGNAVSVWLHFDGANKSVWSNHYTVGSGGTGSWGVAASIDSSTAQASEQRVAMDAEGNAIAIWVQSDGVSESIWVNRFTATAGGSWQGAELLESAAGAADDPHISLSSDGNAVAVWEQSDGSSINTMASHYTGNGSGSAVWTEAVVLDSSAEDAAAPQIALDDRGSALAVWVQSDGATNRVWSSRVTHSGADTGNWDGAVFAESNDTGYGAQPRIGMDSAGNAHMLWQMHGGVDYDIWTNRYIADLP